MFQMMDRGGSYEKLSIRDSARSLKKYGSTSKHVNKNENYIKHYVTNSDTLQGIALKYDVTIEQIRRVNRLFASDSLFLKEFLLIPSPDNCVPVRSNEPTSVVSPTSTSTSQVTSPISNSSFDDDSIDDFLGKIDAAIATTKEEVRKTQKQSEFGSHSLDHSSSERRRPAISRLKQSVNNNGTADFLSPPQAVVVQKGKKVKSSLRNLERQQDELFEL